MDGRIKFSLYINEWKKSARLKVGRAWSICQDNMIRDHIIPYLQDKKMKDITPADISFVLTQSKLKNHAPGTTKKIYLVVNKIFNDAVSFFEILPRSPVKPRFHRPDTFPKERPFLKAERVWEMLEYVKNDCYGIAVHVQLLSGLRVSEIQGLRWGDINFDENIITVSRAYNSITKEIQPFTKNKTHHIIPLVKPLKEYLLLKRRDIGFVCLSTKGKMLHECGYNAYLRRIARELNLPIHSSHGLRHSYARLMVELGASDDIIQAALNHKSVVSTKTYIHRSNERLTDFCRTNAVLMKPIKKSA